MRVSTLWKHCIAKVHDSSLNHLKTASCSFTADSMSYCDGYDDKLYNKMANDTNRTEFYRNCIAKYCSNKVVLDIGCGALALLSVMAAESNASKVYAIEVNESAFRSAKKLIFEKGLSKKIEIMNGYSNRIQSLPQKCDVFIHEIIGEIASGEGVYSVIENAKEKFLKTTFANTNVWSIPDYARTHLMPVEFPNREYWQSLNEKIIPNPRCNTINLWNFPFEHCLCEVSEIGLWEHIPFNGNTITQFVMDNHTFIARKSGVFGGLLSSIEIGVDKDHKMILTSKLGSNNCMWANKLIMLDRQIEVKKGDRIYVTATTDPSEHVLKYDFSVAVETQS